MIPVRVPVAGLGVMVHAVPFQFSMSGPAGLLPAGIRDAAGLHGASPVREFEHRGHFDAAPMTPRCPRCVGVGPGPLDPDDGIQCRIGRRSR